jgi:hypothetical protein
MLFKQGKARKVTRPLKANLLVKSSQRCSRSRLKTRLLRLCHLRNINTVAWWRFVPCSPTRLLGLIIRLSWSHSFLITRWRLHSCNRSATTAVWRRPRIIWRPHAADEQRSGSSEVAARIELELPQDQFALFTVKEKVNSQVVSPCSY